ncbi:non-homologous end joining protein Ku [Silvibacterium acidisoli]|uniref:non-homologous end joining protein Ku n=1 Tax=Acidobacteriaceae bacterium ZG23-2 TaxID=2883246 RepID=UPI00406D13CF
MARPYWSGQIQISLVSFGVDFFPATESKSEIRFHQISRKTGERVRHQKVAAEDGPVENSDIVKGYEYRKGEYVTIEPKEIENLRVASRHTIAVEQFVNASELTPEYFEKPWFVVPESDTQAEAFAVVRKALESTKKVALGKMAFGGREHVVAITAPEGEAGMMAYTLRYAEELRDPADYFRDIKKVTVDEDQLALAEELIKRKAAKFNPEKFKDQYEAALRKMVEAKMKHVSLPEEEPEPKRGKVINLMDALKKSIQGGSEKTQEPKTASRRKKPAASTQKGIALVKPSKSSRSRKSA